MSSALLCKRCCTEAALHFMVEGEIVDSISSHSLILFMSTVEEDIVKLEKTNWHYNKKKLYRTNLCNVLRNLDFKKTQLMHLRLNHVIASKDNE